MTGPIDDLTGKLFGSLWTKLDDKQYQESVELFTKRAIETHLT